MSNKRLVCANAHETHTNTNIIVYSFKLFGGFNEKELMKRQLRSLVPTSKQPHLCTCMYAHAYEGTTHTNERCFKLNLWLVASWHLLSWCCWMFDAAFVTKATYYEIIYICICAYFYFIYCLDLSYKHLFVYY